MKTDDKLIALFERISQIIRVLWWDKARQTDLSPIQMQFLLYICGQVKSQRRVGGLASEFGLTPATVSDAVNSLIEKGLIFKSVSPNDARVFELHPTVTGRRYSRRLKCWADTAKNSLAKFPPAQKETAVYFLMNVIKSMQEEGIIERANMCVTCGHLKKDEPRKLKPYYCSLTDTFLAVGDLKINCPTHTSIQ